MPGSPLKCVRDRHPALADLDKKPGLQSAFKKGIESKTEEMAYSISHGPKKIDEQFLSKKDESKEPDLQNSFKLEAETVVRRSTNLEGIMGILGSQNKLKSEGISGVTSPALGQRGLPLKFDLQDQSGSTSGSKGASLLRAKQMAEDIQKSYNEMMALIGDLQKETGMIVKTQDLEKEFGKVYARVKVIGKL